MVHSQSCRRCEYLAEITVLLRSRFGNADEPQRRRRMACRGIHRTALQAEGGGGGGGGGKEVLERWRVEIGERSDGDGNDGDEADDEMYAGFMRKLAEQLRGLPPRPDLRVLVVGHSGEGRGEHDRTISGTLAGGTSVRVSCRLAASLAADRLFGDGMAVGHDTTVAVAVAQAMPPVSPKPRRSGILPGHGHVRGSGLAAAATAAGSLTGEDDSRRPKRFNNVSPFPSPGLTHKVSLIHAHKLALRALDVNGNPVSPDAAASGGNDDVHEAEETLEELIVEMEPSVPTSQPQRRRRGGIPPPLMPSPPERSGRGKRKYAYSPVISSQLCAFIDFGDEDDQGGAGRAAAEFAARRKVARSQYFLQRRDSLQLAAGAGVYDRTFGSLVGSYEESIMAGRMSAKPSAPTGFVCRVGVLGKGAACKPSLRCPPHRSIAFAAWYYECPDTLDEDAGGWSSPYVGTLEMEGAARLDRNGEEGDADVKGYRIPETGQLQLMLKNQNQTAIKLFLIPYDFSEMPRATTTFIRQKVYEVYDDGSSTLKSAAHCQFVRTRRGRIFLHRSVRLVFTPQSYYERERMQTVVSGPKNPRFVPL